MSTDKKKIHGIPLATLVQRYPMPSTMQQNPARSGVVMHLIEDMNLRNLHMLMGEADAKGSNARLRQALVRALWDSRQTQRKGGARGRQSKKTENVRAHIRDLIAKHPKLTSPHQLFKKADAAILGGMAKKTFEDHVRAVRKK